MGGTLTATMTVGMSTSVSLTGAGSLAATALQSANLPTSFAGDAGLGGVLSPGYTETAPLSGSGTLTAQLVQGHTLSASLGGAGSLTAALAFQYPVAATLSGGGSLTATVVGTISKSHFSDDFNRANSTSLGPNWVTKAASSNTVYGIVQNGSAPLLTTSSFSGGIAAAVWVNPLSTNDMKVSFTFQAATPQHVNDTGAGFLALLGYNDTGEGVAILFNAANKPVIKSSTAWATDYYYSTATLRATASANYTITAGDTWTLQRVGNVYTGLKNGVAQPGLTWTDSGNVVPRDASHRLVGMQNTANSNNTAGSPYTTDTRPFDSWSADDI